MSIIIGIAPSLVLCFFVPGASQREEERRSGSSDPHPTVLLVSHYNMELHLVLLLIQLSSRKHTLLIQIEHVWWDPFSMFCNLIHTRGGNTDRNTISLGTVPGHETVKLYESVLSQL